METEKKEQGQEQTRSFLMQLSWLLSESPSFFDVPLNFSGAPLDWRGAIVVNVRENEKKTRTHENKIFTLPNVCSTRHLNGSFQASQYCWAASKSLAGFKVNELTDFFPFYCPSGPAVLETL